MKEQRLLMAGIYQLRVGVLVVEVRNSGGSNSPKTRAIGGEQASNTSASITSGEAGGGFRNNSITIKVGEGSGGAGGGGGDYGGGS